jgi:hypothetical protein
MPEQFSEAAHFSFNLFQFSFVVVLAAEGIWPWPVPVFLLK